jgi:hypothetical protein
LNFLMPKYVHELGGKGWTQKTSRPLGNGNSLSGA